MKRAPVLVVAFALALAACTSSDDEVAIPVKPAPASRHAALRDGLLADTADDQVQSGSAIAYLAHRTPRVPANIDSVDVALGAVEYAVTTNDRSVVPAIDALIARMDREDYVGNTVTTARLALLDIEVTRRLGEDRQARAIAHDDAIRANAFGDFIDASNKTVRAYAATASSPEIDQPSNVAMLVLKSRLFRVTKDETFRLEARSIYGALQSYAPATTDTQAEFAFATTLLFEITGEDRFIDAADATFDAIAQLRGDGLKKETCAGCAFHALWSLGYRRSLAGEGY